MANKFVHLHVHTEYSLLDGLSKIYKGKPNLMDTVKSLGMDTVAITDHGVMYGAIDFYKKAKEAGIKPIIGMEAYTTVHDHKEKPKQGEARNNHLLLLAKNEEGYKNLIKITTRAHLEGYYYKPRIQRELLKEYSKGLIVTSACPNGEVGRALIENNYEEAKKIALWFLDVFKDDYYLEVQRHESDKFVDKVTDADLRAEMMKLAGIEKTINEGVLKLSRELGIPIVATNDAHYLTKDDAEAQDVLVCVATGKQVAETKRIRFVDTPTFYLRSAEEMAGLFPDLPEALENTVKLAAKCDVEISTLGKWFFPKFDVPGGKTPEEHLRYESEIALKEKYETITTELKDRLELELKIICDKGFAPYFLIVRDLVGWCDENGIVTNTRGSAAGSLVTYVLGITTVDPIKYYLPFERFLNPSRPTPPDIDFDVPDNKREEIIGYMSHKYGVEKVAQICTFGRMLARAAVRDTARVLGYPYVTGDRISKMIPPPKQGFPIDILKALAETPQLKELYDADPDAKKILDLAHQVEGSARHMSVHAAAVVVSPTALTDFVPLQKEPSGEKIITQYEMHGSEDVGLIKFDILGIRNLSILAAAVQIVKETRGEVINIRKIPLDDKKTFEMLGRGETMGTFQLGGGGMTKYLKDLKPTKVEDLMAMVALYRPGPMAAIPEYIERKRNPKLIKFLDPRMEKFLGASYGLLVYQDDLLFCAIDLAGYDWVEADKFRKAVGKKIPEEMAAQKDKFTKGIIAGGQTKDFADMLWKLFEPFQAYGFNKAHAASYGIVAYQTSYMKANYPVEYMTALLTAESNDTDKISSAINECRKMGIKVLPPDINESDIGFKVINMEDSLEGQAIRFGLSAVKNVGKAAIEAILEARASENFTSFSDFLKRTDARRVNKKVLESLIKVGAMSAFGKRASVLASIDDMRAKVIKKNKDESQQGLFGDEAMKKTAPSEISDVLLQQIPEFSEEEIENLERELLGFSVTGKPIVEVLAPFAFSATHKVGDLTLDSVGQEKIKIAGVLREVRVILTKKSGQEMAFAKIEDETGTLNIVVFPSMYTNTRDAWLVNKPVLVGGKVDNRDDEFSLLVDVVEKEANGKSTSGEVKIKIPEGTLSTQLKELKALLLEHPGEQKVTIIFEGKGKTVETNIKISWTPSVARQISEILRQSLS